jgi:hypothetical protein
MANIPPQLTGIIGLIPGPGPEEIIAVFRIGVLCLALRKITWENSAGGARTALVFVNGVLLNFE